MGFDGTNFAVGATVGWEGATAEGPTRGVERSFMDFGHGGAVAGVAEEVSSVPDLPSALSAMGALLGALATV